MFSQLTSYILSSLTGQDPSPASTASAAAAATADGVENGTSRLTSSEAEDEWVLVDRRPDSDDETNCSTDTEDDGVLVVEHSPDRVIVVDTTRLTLPALLTRTTPASHLQRAMDESWFLTPPPCFISTGPVHMETSPLENLLIEHPSMSVYHTHRQYVLRSRSTSVSSGEEEEDREATPAPTPDELLSAVALHRGTRDNSAQAVQQQERLRRNSKRAQKVQIRKASKSLQRGNLDRNNKAREVNSRNRRQRRGERSQGATRSYANNNRKC